MTVDSDHSLSCHVFRDRDEYIALAIHFHLDGIRPHQSVEIPLVSSVSDAHPHFSSPDVAVIFPTTIPLPCLKLSPLAKFLAEKRVIKPQKSFYRRNYLRVNFMAVPLFAVLLLLAKKCIDGHVSCIIIYVAEFSVTVG